MAHKTDNSIPWELAEIEMRIQRGLLDPCDRKRLEEICRCGTPVFQKKALNVLDQAAS